MTYGLLKNWVWCEDCLEFKDAVEEVSFLNIEEGVGGKDVMTFICDKCENEHKNIVIVAATPPRAR